MSNSQLRNSRLRNQRPTPQLPKLPKLPKRITSTSKFLTWEFWALEVGYSLWNWALRRWAFGTLGSWAVGCTASRRLHFHIVRRHGEQRRVGRRRRNCSHLTSDLIPRHDARSERDLERKPSASGQRLDAGNRRERLERSEHRRVVAAGECVGGPQIAAQVEVLRKVGWKRRSFRHRNVQRFLETETFGALARDRRLFSGRLDRHVRRAEQRTQILVGPDLVPRLVRRIQDTNRAFADPLEDDASLRERRQSSFHLRPRLIRRDDVIDGH